MEGRGYSAWRLSGVYLLDCLRKKVEEMKAKNSAIKEVATWLLSLVSVKKKLEKIKKEIKPIYMYDSIELSTIPKKAEAVAGYTGGRWPTFHSLQALFPRAKVISIAISAAEDADCLDVETGDAAPHDVPGWVERQHKRGIKRPILYADLSTMVMVKAYLRNSGIKRESIRLWVSNPTNKPHIPAGYDACQYTWKALNRNLDESQLRVDFWD
jgi:hypothetical protein